MTKTKLRVTRIPDAELIQNCTSSQTAMVRNAALFPGSEPLVANLVAALAPFAEATQAVAAATVRLRALVATKNDRRKELETAYRILGNFVEARAQDNPGLIPAAGMQSTADPHPVYMTQVQRLELTPSVKEGELLAQWRPVRRARSYEVQVCEEATPTPGGWKFKCLITKARCALNRDLVAGQKVWVRVRAIGARGPGAWSDVGWKRVP